MLKIDLIEHDERPIAECGYCGAEIYTEADLQWHDDAKCVGEEERFTSEQEESDAR